MPRSAVNGTPIQLRWSPCSMLRSSVPSHCRRSSRPPTMSPRLAEDVRRLEPQDPAWISYSITPNRRVGWSLNGSRANLSRCHSVNHGGIAGVRQPHVLRASAVDFRSRCRGRFRCRRAAGGRSRIAAGRTAGAPDDRRWRSRPAALLRTHHSRAAWRRRPAS